MSKKLRVTIASMKDYGGGGGFVAAHRLFLAMLKNKQAIDMLVQFKNTNNPNVICPINSKDKFLYLFRVLLCKCILYIFSNQKIQDQTLALFNSGWSKKINQHPTEIINLHWIGGEMISVKEIGKISKPVVWTLHDMWAFSGINHVGYDHRVSLDSDLPLDYRFFDINLNAISRKKKSWTTPIHIVTPSKWLANLVKSSEIMKDWPITVIPNIIDISVFKPLNRNNCKKNFGFSLTKKTILFGAFAGIVNKNKGIDLLIRALDEISESLSNNVELVIFGQHEPTNFQYRRFKNIKWIGHIDNEKKMCELYNASNVVVVPSRVEAFGLVAAEAQACGIPVVAFRNSGIQEVITHMKTGYLANPFEHDDFASGIIWALKNFEKLSPLARQKACHEWSAEVVIPQYLKVYELVAQNYGEK
jgi:glycosyltransferase involved in cell wall biosynthesis